VGTIPVEDPLETRDDPIVLVSFLTLQPHLKELMRSHFTTSVRIAALIPMMDCTGLRILSQDHITINISTQFDCLKQVFENTSKQRKYIVDLLLLDLLSSTALR
jgi:hypothetical protein